jgi:hypothetical protein
VKNLKSHTQWLVAWTVVIGITPISTVQAHRFHTAYVEMERITDTQSLEIAIRVSPEDLVAAFRLSHPDRKLDPDSELPPSDWISSYLSEAITFQNGDPTSKVDVKAKAEVEHPKLKWLGQESLETEVWIYLEGSHPQFLSKQEIRSQIFFEFDGALSNILAIREGSWRKTIHCSPILLKLNEKESEFKQVKIPEESSDTQL